MAQSAVLLCVLAGCAATEPAGDTTCFDYGQLSVPDRSDVLRRVLSEGGLDPESAVNSQGIQRAVDRFCDTSTEPWGGAGRNLNERIHLAVDWTAGGW